MTFAKSSRQGFLGPIMRPFSASPPDRAREVHKTTFCLVEIYTCIHTYTYIHIRIEQTVNVYTKSIYIYIYTHIYIYGDLGIHTHIYTYFWCSAHIHMYTYIYIIYACIWMHTVSYTQIAYVYMYIFMHIAWRHPNGPRGRGRSYFWYCALHALLLFVPGVPYAARAWAGTHLCDL